LAESRSAGAALASRALQAVIVVALVTTITFVLVHLAPGDPFSSALDNPNVTEAIRARWRAAYGLDRPVAEQFVRYLANVARGDLGWSFSMRRPVLDVLLDALPNTLLLTGCALVLGFAGGITLGVVQARAAGTRLDRALGAISMFFYAMPDFWLALMMMLAFAYWLPIFPVGGAVDPVMHDYLGAAGRIADRAKHLVLPALTLALLSAAGVARYQRAELLRVLPEPFLQAARARGVSERRVLLRHALRNALIPMVTLLGMALPVLFTGAVFVERVFAWPGMGWVILNAVATRDYPLVMAGVIVASTTVAVGSLLADVMYTLVDPRLRGR
jgi:peptide/nickel transport system permease protein